MPLEQLHRKKLEIETFEGRRHAMSPLFQMFQGDIIQPPTSTSQTNVSGDEDLPTQTHDLVIAETGKEGAPTGTE